MTSFITPHCISAYLVYKTLRECHYLLIRRCGKYLNGTWQMISGGVDPGEKAWQTALREIREETGLVPDQFYTADAVETFYMRSLDVVTFCPVFLGIIHERKAVILSPHEHDAFEWLSFEEAKERLVFSEQKRIIAHIHANFILKDPNPLFKIEIPS